MLLEGTVTSLSIDLFLSSEEERLQHPTAIYMSREWFKAINHRGQSSVPPSEENIHLFRRLSKLPHHQSADKRPVLTLIDTPRVPMVAHFNFHTCQVDVFYFFGSMPSSSLLWQRWCGPHYWNTIALLCGWQTHEMADPSIHYHCLSDVPSHQKELHLAIVAQRILAHGIHITITLPIPEETHCGHLMLLRIYLRVRGQVKSAVDKWNYCRDHGLLLDTQPSELGSAAIENFLASDVNMDVSTLGENTTRCRRCPDFTGLALLEIIEGEAKERLPDDPVCVKQVLAPHERLRSFLNRLGSRPARSQILSQPVQSTSRQTLDTAPEASETRLSLGPQNPSSILLSPYPHQQFSSHDDQYDNYQSAPMLDALSHVADPPPSSLSSTRQAELWALSNSVLWRDYGFRLNPDFAQMCFTGGAVQVEEHLCPSGLPEDFDYSLEGSELLSHPTRSGAEAATTAPDTKIVSIKDMASIPLQSKAESIDVFVQGTSATTKHLAIDPEKDSTIVPPESVRIGLDIDSFIWIGRELKTAGIMFVHLTPFVGQQPPISKHNHIYIRVVSPPTVRLNQSSEIHQKVQRMKLSQIPHTHFAKIGDQKGVCQISVFFPRMVHLDPASQKLATLIPFEVQEIWWNQLLLPALHEVSASKYGEYIPSTTSEQILKTRSKTHRSGNYASFPTIPIPPILLSELQLNINGRLKNSPQHLQRFGSFFFVAEAKGIKLLTNDLLYGNPWTALTTFYSAFDWDYLQDGSHGELYVDCGITYRPSSDLGNLTGLFRTAALRESNRMSGFQSGTTHSCCTMPRYGSQSAEMTLRHAEQSHIIYRLSYNLCYEVMRNTSNQVVSCLEADAYHGSATLDAEIKNLCTQLRGGKSRSFGCRDEYRIGARGLKDFFLVAKDRVSLHLLHMFFFFSPLLISVILGQEVFAG
jgi:hypothetical protein